MAKKKLEFRPDPNGTGILSKLYITPRQRKKLLKWALYGLLCVAVLVTQDVILSRLTLFGGMAELTPCAIVLICLMEGAESGGVFALAASVFYLFSGTAAGSYCVALITVPAVLAAVFRSNFLRRSFSSYWLCASVAILIYQMGTFLMGLFLARTHMARIVAFAVTLALSVVTMPVLYPLISLIGKIGGEEWKE